MTTALNPRPLRISLKFGVLEVLFMQRITILEEKLRELIGH